MAAWGVNALRHLEPAFWAVPALAMLALAFPRYVEPAARAFGDLSARRPALAAGLLGLATALLVLALPDRAHFVGDFLLRQGTVELAVAPGVLFPQAMPLDVLLHYRIPLALSDAHLLDAAGYGRTLGALEAFALGGLAVLLARAFGLSGVGACALACAAAWSGALGLLSGYSKAFSEMALLAVAVAAFGTRVAREGRGVAGLLVACALGLALHRSGPAFLPAAALALALAFADPRTRPRLAAKGALVGYAALAVALAIFLPMIVRTATSFDMAQHFASEDVRRAGGLPAAAVRPARLLDLLNLAVFFTPLLPLLLVLLPKAGAREVRVVLAIALSWVALALVLFPAQGAFRDWDVFAPAGVALAILAGTLATRARGEWLAAVPALCLAGALLVLGSAHDREGTWRRAEAFMTGPPERTPVERAKTWDYLGSSWFRARRYADAARAFGREAETSRSQRVYLQWALAANEAQDYALAQRVLEELVAFAPGTALAWQQLGALAWQRGDYETAVRAARALAELAPGNAALQRNVRDVEGFYQAWRDSVNAR